MRDRDDIYDLLEELLKNPYPQTGESWQAILNAIAKEVAELEKARSEAEDAKFVTTAEGEQLDRIGEFFGTERKTNEPDDVYRLRLQVALRSQVGSGTIPEIIDVVDTILPNVDRDQIDVEEPIQLEPMFVRIRLPKDTFANSTLSDTDLVNTLEDIVAGGVAVGLAADYIQDETLVTSDEVDFSQLEPEDVTALVDGVDLSDVTRSDEVVTDDDSEVVNAYARGDERTVSSDGSNVTGYEIQQGKQDQTGWSYSVWDTVIGELSFNQDDRTILDDGHSVVDSYTTHQETAVSSDDSNVNDFEIDDGRQSETGWNVSTFQTAGLEFTVTPPSDAFALSDSQTVTDHYDKQRDQFAVDDNDQVVDSYTTETESVAGDDSENVRSEPFTYGTWNEAHYDMDIMRMIDGELSDQILSETLVARDVANATVTELKQTFNDASWNMAHTVYVKDESQVTTTDKLMCRDVVSLLENVNQQRLVANDSVNTQSTEITDATWNESSYDTSHVKS